MKQVKNFILRTKYKIKKIIKWIKFGKIIEEIKVHGEGGPWEIEYRGRGEKVIGYWGYGNWDPNLPYPEKKERK